MNYADTNLPPGTHVNDYDPFYGFHSEKPYVESVAECDMLGCGEPRAEGSPSDYCVRHTIEIIADEIQDTPLSEPAKLAALVDELNEWRKRCEM